MIHHGAGMGWVALSLARHVFGQRLLLPKLRSEFLVRLLSRVLTAGMSPCSFKQLTKWSWREEFACGLAQAAEQSEEQYLHFTHQQNHPDLTVLILLFLPFTAGTLQAEVNAKDTKMWFGAWYGIPSEEDEGS